MCVVASPGALVTTALSTGRVGVAMTTLRPRLHLSQIFSAPTPCGFACDAQLEDPFRRGASTQQPWAPPAASGKRADGGRFFNTTLASTDPRASACNAPSRDSAANVDVHSMLQGIPSETSGAPQQSAGSPFVPLASEELDQLCNVTGSATGAA